MYVLYYKVSIINISRILEKLLLVSKKPLFFKYCFYSLPSFLEIPIKIDLLFTKMYLRFHFNLKLYNNNNFHLGSWIFIILWWREFKLCVIQPWFWGMNSLPFWGYKQPFCQLLSVDLVRSWNTPTECFAIRKSMTKSVYSFRFCWENVLTYKV